VATYYGIDQQYVNTSAQSLRTVVIKYPNAEGRHKAAAAINATMSKWTPAERAEFAASTVPDIRRDFMARITHSGHKLLIAAVALRRGSEVGSLFVYFRLAASPDLKPRGAGPDVPASIEHNNDSKGRRVMRLFRRARAHGCGLVAAGLKFFF